MSGQLQLIDNRRNQLPGQFQLTAPKINCRHKSIQIGIVHNYNAGTQCNALYHRTVDTTRTTYARQQPKHIGKREKRKDNAKKKGTGAPR